MRDHAEFGSHACVYLLYSTCLCICTQVIQICACICMCAGVHCTTNMYVNISNAYVWTDVCIHVGVCVHKWYMVYEHVYTSHACVNGCVGACSPQCRVNISWVKIWLSMSLMQPCRSCLLLEVQDCIHTAVHNASLLCETLRPSHYSAGPEIWLSPSQAACGRESCPGPKRYSGGCPTTLAPCLLPVMCTCKYLQLSQAGTLSPCLERL